MGQCPGVLPGANQHVEGVCVNTFSLLSLGVLSHSVARHDIASLKLLHVLVLWWNQGLLKETLLIQCVTSNGCCFPQDIVKATNVKYQAGHVTRNKRGQVIGQRGGFRGCCVWFTGTSNECSVNVTMSSSMGGYYIPCLAVWGATIYHV